MQSLLWRLFENSLFYFEEFFLINSLVNYINVINIAFCICLSLGMHLKKKT